MRRITGREMASVESGQTAGAGAYTGYHCNDLYSRGLDEVRWGVEGQDKPEDDISRGAENNIRSVFLRVSVEHNSLWS